ncbi:MULTISPECIES: hypothetical protein [Acetobacter]|uniref:Uncharacterized protein n=1 Tax=Acetobacter lovaniensis TaxID=104100 RepID=A0A841QBK0_9PROT|nr:hypothetical protein [Acetobacter lovaniensis]MBB6456149.1 hypothetical protein [Acetobacter lovaniensis]MCI1697856.1 hypothetical protein [Acetobacter lovaniensis]MCI1794552.1 hypothetical protein [Acetobacter lovaniensis]MCP1238986.1 hypothetical protein [Acetobacter lovaniensis]NHN80529.1 hypothetical protein [Acetobacter lovaniensis]
MAQLRRPFVNVMSGLLLVAGLGGAASVAHADPLMTPSDDVSFSEGNGNVDAGAGAGKSTEAKTVHGHRSLPPGYQDAPSMEFQHGDDPDHLAKVHRDSVTGSDLSRYGSAYQNSGPFGSGQVGDSTGNGWVTPR